MLVCIYQWEPLVITNYKLRLVTFIGCAEGMQELPFNQNHIFFSWVIMQNGLFLVFFFFFSLLFQHDACIGLHAVIFSFSWYLQVNNTLYWGHSAKTYLICLMMEGWSFTILIYRLNIIPGTYYIDWQKKSPHCIFSLSYDWVFLRVSICFCKETKQVSRLFYWGLWRLMYK